MDIRCFFKPAGTNPEIKGPYYELSSFALIEGYYNFESLTRGFKKGQSVTSMTFRPTDPTKPIVLAVDDMSSTGFIYIVQHLEEGAEAGMKNYSLYKTDDFLIDCQRGDLMAEGKKYWSITSEGLTFVYGGSNFPDVWQLNDCDPLCALVGGGLTANQLREFAYREEREIIKEKRRQEKIWELFGSLQATEEALRMAGINESLAQSAYSDLRHKLQELTMGWFPFVSKAKVLQILPDNN